MNTIHRNRVTVVAGINTLYRDNIIIIIHVTEVTQYHIYVYTSVTLDNVLVLH